MISVSKLCCPVCWELFDVLNKRDSEKFRAKVRGCHPTVTGVALPETFPSDVSEVMVTRFRDILSGQLVDLLKDSAPRNPQHFRSESESNYSATSSHDGASQCKEGFQSWEKHESSLSTQTATHRDRDRT
jgi:hypothetical protein